MPTPPQTPLAEAHAKMAHTPEPHSAEPPPPRAYAPTAPTAAASPLVETARTPEPPEPQPPTLEPPPQRPVDTTRGFATMAKAAIADNLLIAVFGPMIVLMLGYSLYTSNDRFGEINDRFGEINDRFIALEASINDRLAAQDARIRALEEGQEEINLKLTALIASLNKTDEVEAAISGTITDSQAPEPEEAPP